MSGGSYGYIHRDLEEVARRLMSLDQTVERRAFSKLLLAVSEALHDIDWVDSGDCPPGHEIPKIMAALNNSSGVLLAEAIEYAEHAVEQLKEQMNKIKFPPTVR